MIPVQYFNEDEQNYLIGLILLSKEGLDNCCEDEIPIVDFITPDGAKSEYKMIYNLLNKLNYIGDNI